MENFRVFVKLEIKKGAPIKIILGNKLRPKASENVTLPDPLPECIEKIEESKDLYCPVCELSVNSQQQLTQHLGSTKHKLVSLGLLPKPSEDPTIKRVVFYLYIIQCHYH